MPEHAAASSPAPVSAAAIGVAGLLSLAMAMGIGRFAFTPMLPLMIQDGQLDVAVGGWLAAANYVGYLVGAMTAGRLPLAPRRLAVTALLLTAALTAAMALPLSPLWWAALRGVAGAVSAWAFVSTSVWCLQALAQRPATGGQPSGWTSALYAGVGGGIALTGLYLLVGASTGVGASSLWVQLGALSLLLALPALWVIKRLGHPDRGAGPAFAARAAAPATTAATTRATARPEAGARDTGATSASASAGSCAKVPPSFTGATSASASASKMAAASATSATPAAFDALATAATAPTVVTPPKTAAAPASAARLSAATAVAAATAATAVAAAPATPPARGTRGLALSYGLFGFGYILPATFLPVMARTVVDDPRLFGLAWPVFGATAAISALVASWWLRRASRLQVWAVTQGLMGVGVLLPSLWLSGWTIGLSALLVGGTFMVVTLAGVQETRARAGATAPRALAGLTTAFAIGQIAGPVAANLLLRVPALDGSRALDVALQLGAAGLLASAVWLWRAARAPHAPGSGAA